MKIVFSKRIVRKELWPKPTKGDLAIIRKGCEKWIFEAIKWESLPGENITIKNPEFKKKLQEYLVILFEDLENDDFDTVDARA